MLFRNVQPSSVRQPLDHRERAWTSQPGASKSSKSTPRRQDGDLGADFALAVLELGMTGYWSRFRRRRKGPQAVRNPLVDLWRKRQMVVSSGTVLWPRSRSFRPFTGSIFARRIRSSRHSRPFVTAPARGSPLVPGTDSLSPPFAPAISFSRLFISWSMLVAPQLPMIAAAANIHAPTVRTVPHDRCPARPCAVSVGFAISCLLPIGVPIATGWRLRPPIPRCCTLPSPFPVGLSFAP